MTADEVRALALGGRGELVKGEVYVLNWVHFGLSKAAKADVEVHWPSGVVDKVAGVKANRVITVVEGKG